jgi:hypothetical protein
VPYFKKKKEAELAQLKEALEISIKEEDRELARSRIPKLEEDL